MGLRVKRRRKIDVTNCTLLELAYARTGSMLRAAKVVAFVTAWDVTRRELGREPTMDEYADNWRQARSSAYDERALFREVFPDLHDPGPVLDLLDQRPASAPVSWATLAAA